MLLPLTARYKKYIIYLWINKCTTSTLLPNLTLPKPSQTWWSSLTCAHLFKSCNESFSGDRMLHVCRIFTCKVCFLHFVFVNMASVPPIFSSFSVSFVEWTTQRKDAKQTDKKKLTLKSGLKAKTPNLAHSRNPRVPGKTERARGKIDRCLEGLCVCLWGRTELYIHTED